MRNLESLIAEFVDGLLLAIGDATVEELRELLADTDAGQALYTPEPEPAAAVRAPLPRTGRLARLDPAAALRRSIEASLSSAAAAHSAVADITDPESLLSLGSLGSLGSSTASNGGSGGLFEKVTSARPPPPPPISLALLEPSSKSNGHIEPDADSPASGVRPRWSGTTVRLSDNETLARVSNSGVVIRRKKKA